MDYEEFQRNLHFLVKGYRSTDFEASMMRLIKEYTVDPETKQPSQERHEFAVAALVTIISKLDRILADIAPQK